MTLALSQVSFHYPSRELSGSTSLLHQITFSLDSPGILHLKGQNGSGKTSLLKILAGLLRPEAGTITYSGQDIWANLPAYQQNVCYIGHKNGIYPNLTVWEQAHYLATQYHQSQQTCMQNLQDLNLWSIRDRLCSTLSAGQKRRLALLRLWLSPAKLWLLDEPLNAVDTEGSTFLRACLEAHLAHQGQVIYTSHHDLFGWSQNNQEYDLCHP